MTAPKRAKAHLGKAREFLDAAEMALELDMFNAATSNAVISGINSKDAICLRRTGRTGKSENHAEAIRELNGAGQDTAPLAAHLSRLLQIKSKSQYQDQTVARADAQKAVERARTLHEAAQVIVTT